VLLNRSCVFVSGSQRLGVARDGDDIDAVLVVPPHVSQEMFFAQSDMGFAHVLQSNPNVSHVLVIRSAMVPLIQIVWQGVKIDLLLAQLSSEYCTRTPIIPESPEDLLDDSVLKGADEATIRSLNSIRATELILKLAPNLETFLLVLRSLRLWGKKRGIYSNKLGFLGGINFAIIAVLACQKYPMETASRVLGHLFLLLKNWEWSSPIQINKQISGPNLSVKSWQLSFRDCMSIITPAFPKVNSSYNVTRATLKVLCREFALAEDASRRVLELGEKLVQDDWGSVFAETDFFTRYNTYLTIVAKSDDEINLAKWTSCVESKLRKYLICPLDLSPDIEDVCPYPAMHDAADVGAHAKRWFFGLKFSSRITGADRYSEVRYEVQRFQYHSQRWPEASSANTRLDFCTMSLSDMRRQFPYLYSDLDRHLVQVNPQQLKTQNNNKRSRGAKSNKPQKTSKVPVKRARKSGVMIIK